MTVDVGVFGALLGDGFAIAFFPIFSDEIQAIFFRETVTDGVDLVYVFAAGDAEGCCDSGEAVFFGVLKCFVQAVIEARIAAFAAFGLVTQSADGTEPVLGFVIGFNERKAKALGHDFGSLLSFIEFL